jgi:hypothetical protein
MILVAVVLIRRLLEMTTDLLAVKMIEKVNVMRVLLNNELCIN